MAPPPKSQASPALLAAACALFALLIFAPALRNGFAYDDAITITNQPHVAGHAWGAIWLSPYHVGRIFHASTGIYRPLTVTSFALDHVLFGGRPAGFHATSLVLHAIVTALVVLLALRLGVPETGALAAGLLFAVHPVHVEAVAALAGRSDLLAAGFALAAVLLAARPVPAGLCLLAGMFAKEAALPVAFLLPLLPYLRDRSPETAAAARRLAIACGCAVAVYLAARVAVLGALTLPAGAVTFYENPIVGQPLLTRLLTCAAIFARAAGLLVAPVRLSPDYGFAVIEPVLAIDARVTAGFLLTLGGLATLWLARRRPVVVFLVLWCAATWAIVSNVVVVIGTPLAERQLYLPSIGVCLLAGIGFTRLDRRFRLRASIAALTVVALLALVRTTTGTRAWANDETLFSAALISAPRSIRVLGNLAVERAESGHLEDARELLVRAVDIAPQFVPNLINLAGVQIDLGEIEAARGTAERAVAGDPRSAAAQAQLGVARAGLGDLDGAAAAFREAVALDPQFTDAQRRLDELLRRKAAVTP